MSDVVTIENAELAYEAVKYEGTQNRYSGRLKFACCRQCGSADGMQAIHREALATMYYSQRYVRWHREIDNDEYLFCVCGDCNPDEVIPDNFIEITTEEVLDWLDCDPMQPDYDALAEPESVSQIDDSRDSAGL